MRLARYARGRIDSDFRSHGDDCAPAADEHWRVDAVVVLRGTEDRHVRFDRRGWIGCGNSHADADPHIVYRLIVEDDEQVEIRRRTLDNRQPGRSVGSARVLAAAEHVVNELDEGLALMLVGEHGRKVVAGIRKPVGLKRASAVGDSDGAGEIA